MDKRLHLLLLLLELPRSHQQREASLPANANRSSPRLCWYRSRASWFGSSSSWSRSRKISLYTLSSVF